MVSVRGLTGLSLAVVAVLVLAGSAAAHRSGPRPVPGQRAALTAVKLALAAGRLTAAEARSDRGAIGRSVHLVRVLPSARRARVEVALGQAAALGKRLTAPRAEAVFGQLRANDDYFARRGIPRGGTDITAADGIVYRYFAGRCFEFHPLANFSALNAHAIAKDVAGTERLAAALIARAVPRSGGVAWEYYFPYGGGRAPWVSGMAQAVAAQAFSRAAALVTDESTTFSHEAAGAFATVPGLTTKVAAGPWIRLYSFSSMAVLNAQLQSVLSLETYAKASDDSAAATLASQMEQAAAASVSRFDTGYWTYYALGGGPTPLSYQKFIVQLLHRLAPDDVRFAAAAARFAAYLRQPPAFKLASASGGTLRFWLSKPASVSASTAAGRTVRLGLHAGWHTLRWREPKRAGFYAVHVTAVDWAGNRASFTALPIVHAPTSGRPPTGTPPSSGTGGPTGTSPLSAGVGIDDSGQATLAGSLGLGLVRMTVAWQPGQTTPDPAVVRSLQGLPPDVELAVELEAEQLPTDDGSRTALADYAASLARQTPALRDLVLTPAPSRELATRYADALAAMRAAVRSVRTDVAVGPFFDGSTPKPQSTALALAHQLAQDGAQPVIVSFLPAPVPGAGAWAVGDLDTLESTLAKGLRQGAFGPARRCPHAHDRALFGAGLVPGWGAGAGGCRRPGDAGLDLWRCDRGGLVPSARERAASRPARGRPHGSGAANRALLRERRREAVGACRRAGDRNRRARSRRLSRPGGSRNADHAHVPGAALEVSRGVGCPRLQPRLPLSRRARPRRRAAARRSSREPERRRCAEDDHPAQAEASRRQLPARRPARQPRRPRRGRPRAERPAQRRLRRRRPNRPGLDCRLPPT